MGKIVVVADMEAYSDSAVPSMATRVECLRLAQARPATYPKPKPKVLSLVQCCRRWPRMSSACVWRRRASALPLSLVLCCRV